jgi:N-acylglucosamine 2-epimerase
MDRARLTELRDVYRRGLLEDTLPFWLPACLSENGGFACFLDREGRRYDQDKSVWHQGRFAWLLGTLARTVEPREEWVRGCERGVDFLRSHCIDPGDGRYWFHLDGDNRPLRKRRYVFSEAFAAQAFAAHAALSGDSRSADDAWATWEQMRRFMTTPGLIAPKWTETRPLKALGPPMIRIGVAQELRAMGDDARLDAEIDVCVAELEAFVHADRGLVFEQVAPDGSFVDSVEGRTLNPGHAIEAAWFLLEEARYRGGEAQLVDLACRILDASWRVGWDGEHGGLLYFVDALGHPVQEYWHDMKFWWPHNEAVLATLMAHAATGDERYADWHRDVHDWAHAHFPDPEHGEWFGYLHRDGRVSSTAKGNLWKGPFHLPRMQWRAWRLCEELLAP